ncbi:hypothetical protein Glove_22g219 [Diversispora epigaea]|uniref:Glycosyltransferase family 49 protein n=1 Tax=Diversispora epigaea TaxID=1348612 RepID=A0A397JRF3_9GLOM|nr:hypothetical protein Glove_22g219 [Diversispora epigaea]
MVKLRAEGTKIISKGIKWLVQIYVVLSVMYTLNHFYTEYLYNDLDGNIIQRNEPELETQIPLSWGQDRLSWKSHSGVYDYMTEEFFLSKVFSESMQPSHVIPYYFRAQEAPNEEDITITTLITLDRFSVFDRLATNYKGPISVTIHVNDDQESRDKLINALHDLYNNNPYMKQYVDVHLVVDKFERQFNMWRNIAKFFARTNYVMMLDVDFHPCTNFRRTILDSPEIMEKLRAGNTALVVPAFEYADLIEGLYYTTFPRTKEDAIELVNSKRLVMFHAAWKPGHGSSNYTHWYGANELYKVTQYQYQYEPYVIFPKHSIWCDERFVGYGANKAACLFELYLSGIDYWVLPNDFLIHQTHEYLESARRNERKFNKKLYDHFREELCFRYARNFIINGEWETPKAHNLKETCQKIRGFTQAIKYFTKADK